MSEKLSKLEYRYTNGYHHCPVLAEKNLPMYCVEPPRNEDVLGCLYIIDMVTTEKSVVNFIKCCPFCSEELKPIKVLKENKSEFDFRNV